MGHLRNRLVKWQIIRRGHSFCHCCWQGRRALVRASACVPWLWFPRRTLLQEGSRLPVIRCPSKPAPQNQHQLTSGNIPPSVGRTAVAGYKTAVPGRVRALREQLGFTLFEKAEELGFKGSWQMWCQQQVLFASRNLSSCPRVLWSALNFHSGKDVEPGKILKENGWKEGFFFFHHGMKKGRTNGVH